MSAIKKIVDRIKNFVPKFHKRNTGEYMNPVRDWIFGLLSATVLLIAGAVFIATDFHTQFNVTTHDTPKSKPIVHREKEIKTYAELYRQKEEIFNELRKNRQYVEPAIEPEKEDISQKDEEADVPVADVQLAQ